MAMCSYINCSSIIEADRLEHRPNLCLKLPNEATTKKIWLENLNLNDIVPIDSDAAWICSQHFKQIYTEKEFLDIFIDLGMAVEQEIKTTQPKIESENHSIPTSYTIIPPYKLTCHTCLAQTATLLSPSLAAAFTQATGVSVAEARLPCALCATCVALLAKCIQFRQDSLKAECVLKKRAEEQSANSSGVIHIRSDPISKVQDFFKIEMSQDSDFDNEKSTQTSKAIKKGSDLDMSSEDITHMSINDQDSTNINNIDTTSEDNTHIEFNETETKNDFLKVFEEQNFLSKEEQRAEHERKKERNNYISSKFKCDLCYLSFKCEETLQTHSVKHTEKCGKYVCELCKCHFKTKRKKREHKNYSHKHKFTCKLCSFTTFNKCTANNHFNWHNGTAAYLCKICNLKFDFPTSFLSHNRIKHPSSDYVCGFCGYSFLSPNGLGYHRIKKHCDETIAEDGPRCVDCDIVFSNETAFITHQRVSPKHGGNCRNEPKYNFSKNSRKVPQNPIEQIKMKKLLQQYNDPISCEMCDYKSVSIGAYTQHFRRHHANRERALCPENNPRLCYTCGLTFECPNEYTKHRFNFHGPGKSPAAGNKSFKCDICQKEFRFKTFLREHITSKHLGWRHACPTCGKTFNLQCNRDRHCRLVHSSVKSVKCTHCDKYFKDLCTQKFHIKSVHYKIPYIRRPGYQRPNKKREDKSDS